MWPWIVHNWEYFLKVKKNAMYFSNQYLMMRKEDLCSLQKFLITFTLGWSTWTKTNPLRINPLRILVLRKHWGSCFLSWVSYVRKASERKGKPLIMAPDLNQNCWDFLNWCSAQAIINKKLLLKYTTTLEERINR